MDPVSAMKKKKKDHLSHWPCTLCTLLNPNGGDTTHHAPRTTHHAPRTTHHAPRTVNPKPWSLIPDLETLNPKP